jgi:Protein of unknown function (DUF1800)
MSLARVRLPVHPVQLESQAPSVSSSSIGAVSLVSILLAGCGGGSAQVGTGSSPAPAPAPGAAPVAAVPPSAKEASRFLGQATMGANQSAIDALVNQGIDQWISAQMQLPVSDSHWDFLLAKGYSDLSFKNNEQGFDRTVWRKLISAPDQLRQRVVFALSEIFVVGIGGVSTSFRQFACANYLDLLEKHEHGDGRVSVASRQSERGCSHRPVT